MYYWFVSFYFLNSLGGSGFGNTVIKLNQPHLPINQTTEQLKNELKVSQVTIISFQQIPPESCDY